MSQMLLNIAKSGQGELGIVLTSSMRHPWLIIRILFLTKTTKTLAVTQGLRPLFLLRLRLAPKQASASRSRRRNSLRSSGLHHSKKNLEKARAVATHTITFSHVFSSFLVLHLILRLRGKAYPLFEKQESMQKNILRQSILCILR